MGMSSYDCLVCGRDLMSEWSHKDTPEWMRHVVVFMPDDVRIAGEYTGYSAVKTEETIWSEYVDCEGYYRDDDTEGISIIHLKDLPYDENKSDSDPGYTQMYMWENSINNPSCYHRACWESVGSPEGFRGASMRSDGQGFGSGGFLFREGDDDDEPWHWPRPGEDAMKWWAVNSVCHFISRMGSLARVMAAAERQRELHRTMDRIDEMVKAL